MTGVNNSPFPPSNVQFVKHWHSFASVHLQTMRNCESDKPGSVGHETDADGWGEGQASAHVDKIPRCLIPSSIPSFLPVDIQSMVQSALTSGLRHSFMIMMPSVFALDLGVQGRNSMHVRKSSRNTSQKVKIKNWRNLKKSVVHTCLPNSGWFSGVYWIAALSLFSYLYLEHGVSGEMSGLMRYRDTLVHLWNDTIYVKLWIHEILFPPVNFSIVFTYYHLNLNRSSAMNSPWVAAGCYCTRGDTITIPKNRNSGSMGYFRGIDTKIWMKGIVKGIKKELFSDSNS